MAKEASAHVGSSWTQVASEEVVEVDQEQGLELVPPFPRLLEVEGPQVLEASALLPPPPACPHRLDSAFGSRIPEECRLWDLREHCAPRRTLVLPGSGAWENSPASLALSTCCIHGAHLLEQAP